MAASNAGSRNLTWTLLVALIFTYALASIAARPLDLNGDSALHIQAAERIISGGHAAVDAIDTNPPLIMYLTVIPTAAAQVTGLHPVTAFLLTVWLFTVISTLATRQLLLEALPPREAIHAHLLGVSLALVTITLLRRTEFGQREHLFIFGVLPYLIVRFRRWEGIAVSPRAAAATGLAAGVAASIKPQLALIVLVPELYWLLALRVARPLWSSEVRWAIAAVVAYLSHFLVWRDIGDAFFGRWVPLLVSGFGAYNGTFEAMLLLHSAEWLPAMVAILALLLRTRTSDVAWRLIRPLALATLTATAVYVAQHKGWTYHALPIRVLAFAIGALTAGRLLVSLNDNESSRLSGFLPSRLHHAAMVAVIFMGAAAALVSIGPKTRQQLDRVIAESPLAQEIVADSGEGEPVLVVSTDAWDSYPLLAQLRRPQASRFLFMFPVALLYNNAQGNAGTPFPFRGVDGLPMPDAESRFQRELAADIEHHRPKVVFIDTRATCLACPPGFSLYDYFERTGFLSTALAGYKRSRNVDRFATFLPVG